MPKSLILFQSTRPRGARPDKSRLARFVAVSIHAPARGATRPAQSQNTRHCFNPRARAGRDRLMPFFTQNRQFQSTRPRGARQIEELKAKAGLVSIHAPARGATRGSFLSYILRGFNPRARAGRD